MKALPKTRSEVSAKLKVFQLSLRRRHSSLFWPLADKEIVERMVLLQWSLADTCMSALSSVLVIDMNWIAARTPHQLARPARHWTSTSDTSAYILPAWHQLFNALLTLARTETGNVIPGSSGFPGSCHKQHQQRRLFPKQGLRCLPNSSFLSFRHCEGDTLHWSDFLTRMESVEINFLSAWPLAGTCMSALSSVYTGDRYKMHCCMSAKSTWKTGKALK